MRRTRAATTAAITLSLLAATATACGGGSANGDGGSNSAPKELTYWASNQGPDIAADEATLAPELKKFEERTGIKVKLEVIPWPDLLGRILAATASGQGPDVLNIGNTWSASLQATGALLPWDGRNFDAIGGKDRFVASALGSAGATGQDPAAVPLYSMSYALYYNKKLFREAGIEKPRPPGTRWSPSGSGCPRTASGPSAPRVRTSPTTSTRSSSSPSSTARTSSTRPASRPSTAPPPWTPSSSTST